MFRNIFTSDYINRCILLFQMPTFDGYKKIERNITIDRCFIHIIDFMDILMQQS